MSCSQAPVSLIRTFEWRPLASWHLVPENQEEDRPTRLDVPCVQVKRGATVLRRDFSPKSTMGHPPLMLSSVTLPASNLSWTTVGLTVSPIGSISNMTLDRVRSRKNEKMFGALAVSSQGRYTTPSRLDRYVPGVDPADGVATGWPLPVRHRSHQYSVIYPGDPRS